MTCGEKIAMLRKQHHLTQAQLGRKLNLSAQAISKWENNLAEPDLNTLIAIAKLFNVSVDELLGIKVNDVSNVERTNETPKYNPQMIAVCVDCGEILTNDNLAQLKPFALCKNCMMLRAESAKRAKENERQKEKALVQHEYDQLKSTRKKGVIWGSVLAGVALLICVIIAAASVKWTTGQRLGLGLGGIAIAYAAFATVCECIIFDSFIVDILEDCISSPIKMPGVLFEFSVEGCMAFIVLKIALWLIGLIIGVAIAIFGICFALLMSSIMFPFHWAKYGKNMRDKLDERDAI